MKKQKKVFLVKLIAFALAVSLIPPCTASAATVESAQPYGSYYLTSYNTYICAMGYGRIEIWFSVVGTSDMDEIGTLSIMVYESTDNQNWTWVKTYLHENYPSMLAYNDFFHSSYVTYQGIAGRYYNACVCIWAGKDGDGDSRYMWTGVEQAT